jgi:hypothetical protein
MLTLSEQTHASTLSRRGTEGSISRLGPALMASAYEHLVPIHRQIVSLEKTDCHRRKEQRPWAM